MAKKILLGCFLAGVFAVGSFGVYIYLLHRELPQILKVEDYKPALVSYVYARNGEKISELFREENRILTPYEKLPKTLVQAFLAAEDDKFFEHGGINYQAILRAFIANMRAGRTVQGGSTITQQVAKSFFLSSERKLSRKIKEAMLAYELEKNLKKEDILYLYLNQIFFGEQAYGVAAAAETYFRKSLDQLTIAECALLAGLPQAPSRYSPIRWPQRAKDRQRYVINRMAEVGYITREQADQALNEPIQVYLTKDFMDLAPDYVEAVRQLLVRELGEPMVLEQGIKIYTSLDLKAQQEAVKQVREGLKAVDKRQGYRGPIRRIESKEETDKFLLAGRRKLERDKSPVRLIMPNGQIEPERPMELVHRVDAKGTVLSNLPDYVTLGSSVEAVVTKVDDKFGLVSVRFAEVQALLDISDMSWARKPDPSVASENAPALKVPSQAIKEGDVILVKVNSGVFSSPRLAKLQKELVTGQPSNVKPDPNYLPGYAKLNTYAQVALDQTPAVEGALLSFDHKTQDLVAMVGGYDFEASKFNRALQAYRQTGSAFKAIIYLSALDKGWNPARVIADAPIVFDYQNSEAADGQQDVKTWRPHNYGNKFEGDMLFRQALVQSLNIPTVKILEDVGIGWAVDYARRLGIFSPLNQDLSLALGSSGITLYEMTKVFAAIANSGKRVRPVIVKKVVDQQGTVIRENLLLDKRFEKEIAAVDQYLEERRAKINEEIASETTAASSAPNGDVAVTEQKKEKFTPKIFFSDPEQLISPQTAYLITNILSASITDENGTAVRARAFGRPTAGKTGTTNGYFDTWFVGYTPQYTTGVWVGFDQERSLGSGEGGGRTALPIWLEYMKQIHQDIPPTSFPVPDGIVFANIDKRTGKLASAKSKEVVYQAFLRGTEPKELSESASTKDETDFYKEDLTE